MMRDMVWQGKKQKLTFNIGTPKGMKLILEESRVNTRNTNGDQMRKVLGDMDNFKREKSRIEHFLASLGHICLFLPKFHPELEPYRKGLVSVKAGHKGLLYCKYTLPSLRKNIPVSFESVTAENIANYFRKVRDYVCEYLEDLSGGPSLEDQVKKNKQAVKSYRRISINQ